MSPPDAEINGRGRQAWSSGAQPTAATGDSVDAPPPGPIMAKQRSIGLAVWLLAGVAGVMAMLTASVLIASAAVALLTTLLVDRLTARRSLVEPVPTIIAPVEAGAGQPIVAQLRVEGLVRPVVVRVRTPFGDEDVFVSDDRPGTVSLPPSDRGVRTSMLVDVVCPGPLGLCDAARRHLVVFAVPLSVAPEPAPHDLEWPAMRTLAMATTETAPVGDELVRGVRPYRRGDSPRRVHWKATARHDSLMVTDSDGLGMPVVRVVVHLAMVGLPSDWATRRAIWVIQDALARGWRVRLVTRQPVRPPPLPTAVIGSAFDRAAPAPLYLQPGASWDPYLPSQVEAAVAGSTVSDVIVRSPRQARRLLAAACPGAVPHTSRGLLTRVVTEEGDRWL